MKLSPQDIEDLKYAKKLIEHPSLAARLTDILASSIERGFAMLPHKWAEIVHAATRKSIEKALKFAMMTMKSRNRSLPSNIIHKAAVMTSGATGGAFGLVALPIELPISTVIMLRSISDIARSEGEDLNSPETMLNCLQIFALGGRSDQDNATETGYYTVRAALSKAVSDAVQHIANRGLTEQGAPVLVRLITTITSRFGVIVSEKVAAMAIPAIGAVGGALINTIFMDHFQNIAQGHFTIRRLERKYGAYLI
jgi:hypothetical protein